MGLTRLASLNNPCPPVVGKFTDDQIAAQANWNRIGWDKEPDATMHTIHVVPFGASTSTTVNTIDPATADDGYMEAPRPAAPVVPAYR